MILIPSFKDRMTVYIQAYPRENFSTISAISRNRSIITANLPCDLQAGAKYPIFFNATDTSRFSEDNKYFFSSEVKNYEHILNE